MVVQHALQSLTAAGIVTLIVFMVTHDVDHLRESGTDLFKKSLADSTYGGVIVHIHSLADIASKNQHIG
jgi:hypothetical protein